ncbi:MAG: peptidylprolyl isomerase [Pyrinomonadaceae bacterium]|nr:peptidylprolyl isomerase [Pyrinomonadaceae bacterium]
MNDAQIAILNALVKLDRKAALAALINGINSGDYVVRRHTANLIRQNDLIKFTGDFEPRVGTVRNSIFKQADYVRAVSRQKAKAVVTTEKGVFTIELSPQDAPLNVESFIALANKNYFDGIAFHRIVPNFVVQGGDPRGDGNGGPNYQIRCEINELAYERGAVGMALSGKDTGGSQFFVTHSSQPHLDGGYTVFGKVDDSGMKVVDKLSRGDKIISVKIVEDNSPQKSSKTLKKVK